MQDGLYCSGGYDWFSIGSEGNVYTCNALVYRPDCCLGNIFEDDIVLRTEEFQRCPIQMCEQICDRHWARKEVYKNDRIASTQEIVNSDVYKGKNRPVSILYSPTWKCNYSCTYCHLPTPKEFPNIDNACKVYPYSKWIERLGKFFDLNGIDGGIAHTNGGEPLFYDGIEHIFEFFYKREFTSAITTNLSADVYKIIIDRVPKEGIGIINASLHPTDKNFRWELFKSRIMLLRSFDYPVKVNLVAHPDQVMLIPEYDAFFRSINVPLSVIPMVSGWSGVSFRKMEDYPKPLREILEKYVSENLTDDNRFIEGNRVTEKKLITRTEKFQKITLPVLGKTGRSTSNFDLPDMNSIRTVGHINKTTDKIDPAMTKELYAHIQERRVHYDVSDDIVSEWLLNRKIAINERNNRATHLNCKPLYVDIELNNMCNLECEFCTCVHNHVRNASLPEAKLTVEEIDDLSEVFKYAEIMETSKGGEPCMTPDLFVYALQKIRDLNPFVIIHTVTNGTAISDRLLKSLICNKLDHMYVSISGDNKDNYHKSMGKDKYDKAIEGLKRVQIAKLESGSREPFVHFNTQLCKYADPFVILDLAAEYDVIEVNFIKTQMTAGVQGNEIFQGASVEHYMKKAEIEDLMDRIVKKANDLHISINFPGWNTKQRRIIGSKEYFYYPHLTKYFDMSMTCPTDAPWFRYCTSMRTVQPCCWSGGFADWTKKSFESIWNGPYLKNLRQQLSKGVYPDVCHCKY